MIGKTVVILLASSVVVGGCKSVARSEPPTEEQWSGGVVRAIDTLKSLITDGAFAKARKLAKQPVGEARDLPLDDAIMGLKVEGQEGKVINFFASYAERDGKTAMEMLDRIPAAQTDDEVVGILRDLRDEIDQVTVAYHKRNGNLGLHNNWQYNHKGAVKWLDGFLVKLEEVLRVYLEDIPRYEKSQAIPIESLLKGYSKKVNDSYARVYASTGFLRNSN